MKTWTKHYLPGRWVKFLARGAADLEKGGFGYVGGSGAGHGSASVRAALHRRGLIHADHTISRDGLDALAEARQEGW